MNANTALSYLRLFAFIRGLHLRDDPLPHDVVDKPGALDGFRCRQVRFIGVRRMKAVILKGRTSVPAAKVCEWIEKTGRHVRQGYIQANSRLSFSQVQRSAVNIGLY